MSGGEFADSDDGSGAPSAPRRNARLFSMSVYLQMLGRQLPCNLLDLLQVKPLPLPMTAHDELVARVEAGQAYPDVHYKLGLSHLGRQELGLARKHLAAAVEAKPAYTSARLALATVCDLMARHAE